MMNRREAICKKIEAVKIWLVSAEQNFINDNSLRGELDLMLAEAEMSDIKKTSKMRQKLFFSINILVIIGVFFSISFIYFAKGDIISPEDKKMEFKTDQTKRQTEMALSETKVSDIEQPIIKTEVHATIDKTKELFVQEKYQEISSPVLTTESSKYDAEKIPRQIEKSTPILTAEETREMVKLARENLRR